MNLKFSTFPSFVIAFLMSFALLNCGGTPSQRSAVTINLPTKNATVSMNTLTLRVTGTGMSTQTESTTITGSSDAEITSDVLRGESRTFEVFIGLSSSDKKGFYGASTTDVDENTLTVPIAVSNVNFGLDAEGVASLNVTGSDTSVQTADITSVDVDLDNPSEITFRVEVANVPGFFEMLIELDVDNDASTPVSDNTTAMKDLADDSILNTATTKLLSFDPGTFTGGSEFVIKVACITGTQASCLDDTAINTFYQVFVADKTLSSIFSSDAVTPFDMNNGFIDMDIVDSTGGKKFFTIKINRSEFLSEIDPDGKGVFNVAAGKVISATYFVPSDVAFDDNAFEYDINFDASSPP